MLFWISKVENRIKQSSGKTNISDFVLVKGLSFDYICFFVCLQQYNKNKKNKPSLKSYTGCTCINRARGYSL